MFSTTGDSPSVSLRCMDAWMGRWLAAALLDMLAAATTTRPSMLSRWLWGVCLLLVWLVEADTSC
jgi:hypothetical protein